MTPVSLGIDLGTSAVKAVRVDEDGRTVASARRGYEVRSPHPGWAQTPVSDWLDAAVAAVADACGQATSAEVVAVGIDGQMHGLVAVDAEGVAVRDAMLWPDARAGEQLRHWRGLPDDVHARLANPLAPGMSGPMLRWLRDAEPEAYARTRRVLSPKDWLRDQLVPAGGTDPTDASATLLWDVVADAWSDAVVRGVGLDPALLPPPREPDTVAGVLDRTAAARWGLPDGVPVAVGCSDVAATLLGLDAGPAELVLVVGTGAQAISPVARVAPDPAPRWHAYRAVDGWYAMAAVQNAGLALDWAVRALGATWDELYAAIPADPHDVRDGPLFVPYLGGEREPPTAAGTGAWRDLGLHTTRADLLRAVAEGVTFGIRRAVEMLDQGSDPVAVVGGGVRRAEFRQLLADVLARPVRRVDVDDATAAGAALLGWRAGHGRAVPARAPRGEPLPPGPTSDACQERYAAYLQAVTV
ncbi:MAG: FGGY family carbohydrate kinase [Streptosporangiales bacterium]